VFTAPAIVADRIQALSQQTATPVTRIGSLTSGTGVRVVDGNGQPLPLPQPGYRHF
jgi:thiamine-monophosphate kinase